MAPTCSAVCCSVSAHHTISAGDTRCLEGTAVCADSRTSNAANKYWATERAIRLECRTKSLGCLVKARSPTTKVFNELVDRGTSQLRKSSFAVPRGWQ